MVGSSDLIAGDHGLELIGSPVGVNAAAFAGFDLILDGGGDVGGGGGGKGWRRIFEDVRGRVAVGVFGGGAGGGAGYCAGERALLPGLPPGPERGVRGVQKCKI